MTFYGGQRHMESTEKNKIGELSKTDKQLNRLAREHQRLEDRLARFENRPFLTVLEELEQKKLKLQKLRGKEQMMRILSEYEGHSITQ